MTSECQPARTPCHWGAHSYPEFLFNSIKHHDPSAIHKDNHKRFQSVHLRSMVQVVKDSGKFKDRRDFLSKAPGVRGMFRDAKLKLQAEEDLTKATRDETGDFLLAAKVELRKYSHLGSNRSMDDHWEGMVKAEPGTHQIQYLATYVHDLHKAVEVMYAANLEMLYLLRHGRDGVSTENGSSSSKPAVSNDRSLKGTTIAKEIRQVVEAMILEQPFSLRGSGKHIISTICSSRLLWTECSHEEKVFSFIR